MAYVGKITDTSGTTGPVGSTLYGTCATAADQAAKVVTCADFDKLITGVTVVIKFTYSNTSTGTITLNVNGTGAKNMYRYGTTKPGNYAGASWQANSIVSVTYDGNYWMMNDFVYNDNTYDRTSIQGRIYAGTTGVFPYSIIAIDNAGKMQAMTTTGGTGTSKEYNSSQKFRYPPVIMYHSENATKTNDQIISNNVMYEQFPNVDLRYSSNITSSAGFDTYIPIYLECTFDSDGYWSPTKITQTLLAGKYYILLGFTYSTSVYQLALIAQHPVYKCTTGGTLEMLQVFTKTEKDKLAGIEDQANKYVHPTYTAKSDGMYRITVNGTGHVSAATAIASADVSTALNLLGTGTSNPQLADYYISQYAGGGTTTTTYHRRPISKLWNTFKGLITVATTGDGNAITSVSIANDGDTNRKITFTKGSTFSLSSHTHNLSIATDTGTSSITLAASTKYKLTAGGSTYVFTTPPNTDRYVNSAAFADDTTANASNPVKMTLTIDGSDTATVTANIPKVSSSSAGVVPKGAAVSSQSQTTKFLREDGSWAAPSYTSIPSGNVTGSSLTADQIILGNGNSTIKASGKTIATSITDVDTTVPTSKAVKTFIEGKGYVTTDENVKQSSSVTSNYRPLMLGYTNTTTIADLAATVTNQVYATTSIFAKPSNGTIYATQFSTSGYASGDKSAANISGSGALSYLYFKSYYTNPTNSTTYNYSSPVITGYGNKGSDDNGRLIAIQSGGLIILGSGEAATNLAGLISDDVLADGATKLNVGGNLNTAFGGADEQLILASDNNIYFIPKCGTVANRNPVVLDVSKNFYPGVNNSGSIGTSSYKWANGYFTNINGVAVGDSPKFTDTTYSAGTGLSLSGTTINHSNSITAGTAKGDDSKTLTFGGTFTIPSVTYDAQGHITAKGTTTMTMPDNPVPSGNVTGTSLTADQIILGNGNSTIKASGKTIATSITDVDTTVPTSKAVKTFVEGKGYVTTDENVKQENTTTNASYRILLSKNANDTTETSTARKSTNLQFNPAAAKITLGTTSSPGSIYMPGSGSRASTFTSSGITCNASTGGWIMGMTYYTNDGETSLGTIGAFGTGDTLSHFYIGGTYTSPLIKVDSAGRLTTTKAINDFVTGTGTAAQDKGSGVSPRYFPAKWSFDTGQTATNGDIVVVKIPCAGSDYGVFVSIDNDTNYYPVSVNGTTRLTTHYANGQFVALMFKSDGATNQVFPLNGGDARVNITGGAWIVLNYYDSGNTYDRNRYNASIKAWGTKIISGNIIVGTNGLYHHLKEGTAFDISYPILYLAGDCNASSTTTNTYDQINFTITTTQNITLTAYKPVYIKGKLSGTTFTPVSTTPLTQTIPSTDDGYVYILLGNATSTTAVFLLDDHRLFAYKNGVFGELAQHSMTASTFTSGYKYYENSAWANTPWHKIATCTLTDKSYINTSYFIVTGGWGDAGINTYLGIVKVMISSGSTVGTLGSYACMTWIFADNAIDPANYALQYQATSGTSIVFNIYAKQTQRYDGVKFMLIQSRRVTGLDQYVWILEQNTSDSSGVATIPTGTDIIYSSFVASKQKCLFSDHTLYSTISQNEITTNSGLFNKYKLILVKIKRVFMASKLVETEAVIPAKYLKENPSSVYTTTIQTPDGSSTSYYIDAQYSADNKIYIGLGPYSGVVKDWTNSIIEIWGID